MCTYVLKNILYVEGEYMKVIIKNNFYDEKLLIIRFINVSMQNVIFDQELKGMSVREF